MRIAHLPALLIALFLCLAGLVGCDSEDSVTFDFDDYKLVAENKADKLQEVEGPETLVRLYRKDMEEIYTYSYEGQIYVVVVKDGLKKTLTRYVDDDNDGKFTIAPSEGNVFITGYN